MRALLLRVWALPWPPALRQAAAQVIDLPWVQRGLFPHYLVGVIGIIRNEAGEVLLVHHTYRHRIPWGLPAGFLERHEQPREALLREIEEETGLKVDLSSVWHVYTSDDRPLVNIVYRGRYLDGVFTPSAEVSAAEFVRVDDLPPLPAGQRELIEACVQKAPVVVLGED
jgi:ADP-ribose pyrophosphatase YjhB (NUDIX family)